MMPDIDTILSIARFPLEAGIMVILMQIRHRITILHVRLLKVEEKSGISYPMELLQ